MKNICFICGKEKSIGIILKDKFICRDCENKIVTLEPGNDFYEFYRRKVRDIYKGYSYLHKRIGE